ncbi:MAG: hypothetical protein IKF71_03135 [Bacilli bacterium]|nr:hypothetical protein [Bacilli bacterium]
MNEGLGSTVIIAIIVVFIALVSAYMAYNVNYTKAFRMKNKIVATIEKYDGDCTNTNGCMGEIKTYADKISYRPSTTNFCDNNKYKPNINVMDTQYFSDPGFCLYKVKVRKTESGSGEIVDDNNHQYGFYYRVATIINIRVPIIENMMQFNYVSGDTKDFHDKKYKNN